MRGVDDDAPEVPPHRHFLQAPKPGADGGVVGEAQENPAELRLVENLRGDDLHHHRVAHLPGRRHRFVGAPGRAELRDGDAVGPQPGHQVRLQKGVR